MKTRYTPVLAIALAALSMGDVRAESLRGITVDQSGSYALDTDSIRQVKDQTQTAFTVLTVYNSKMTAPNQAGYIRANTAFLADCKAETQALTEITLMDDSGRVVYRYTPSAAEAPMLRPAKGSRDAKILAAACAAR